MSLWSPGLQASPSFGHERLSVSSTADSPSGASTVDPPESVTSESATYSPADVKSDPDEAFDLASLASPLEYQGSGPILVHEDPGASRAPLQSVTGEAVPPEGKRRRGRPRKHPVIKPVPEGKTNNGRSKTGCITCRRRKKKCDEGKPGCNNCKKNNVACEGYKKPAQWQSTRSKSGSDHKNNGLPQLLNGMKDEIDRLLLHNFLENLSPMLYIGNSDCATPINDLIIPLAVKDRGLLYSVLCLSGFKLSENAPDPECDATLRKNILKRAREHYGSALSLLGTKLDRLKAEEAQDDAPEDSETADDTVIAHIMMLCLQTIVSGDHCGAYRFHLEGLREMMSKHQSSNEQLQRFSEDFLLFHSTCSSIICTPSTRLPLYFPERFRLPEFVPPEAGSYFGILDGLFLFLHQITELRDRIRERRAQQLDPAVDFPAVHSAQRIDSELREWTCHQPVGTTFETASLLYNQCTWIYLHRTILPSRPQPNLRAGVDEGLRLLLRLRDEDAVQAILVMPLFLLGCSAFEEEQRPQITETFDILLRKRGTANIGHVQRVVQSMWRLMDAGKEESWDWEGLMRGMDMDFLLS